MAASGVPTNMLVVARKAPSGGRRPPAEVAFEIQLTLARASSTALFAASKPLFPGAVREGDKRRKSAASPSGNPGVDWRPGPAETSSPMDVRKISIGSFEDEPDDLGYWLQQRPEDRLAAIEHLRQQFFAYGEARQELRRFLEIAELPRS
jgi:hypothetical protein